MVLAAGLYFREQSSPLYTVDTAGKAVEVGCGAAVRQQGTGSAAGEAARVYCNSRRIGAIIVWFVLINFAHCSTSVSFSRGRSLECV